MIEKQYHRFLHRDMRVQLGRLDVANSAQDMNLPGWTWHLLKRGDLGGRWAVWADENYRLSFTFDGTDAVLVDYQEYH